ncbi:MAG: ABC transporter permease subunit [Pseudomonadota bacterium]
MAQSGRGMGWGRRLTILVPYTWLAVFFLLPFFIVLKISVSEPVIAMPPFAPQWDSFSAAWEHLTNPIVENYTFLFSDPLYVNSYLNSLRIAGISTLLTLLVGYPMAYGMARCGPTWRAILLTLVILPFWTSFLIRVYAWIGILKTEGLLNLVLLSIGVITEPLEVHLTPVAVYIGIVYSYLPFMVLPLYASLEKLDTSLLEAAADLGARARTVFWRVVFPLSLPGVAAGCFLVFIPAVGEFVIPELLGGASTQMIGRTLWSEFFQNRDWPVASAVAVLLVLVLVVPIVIFQKIARKGGTG